MRRQPWIDRISAAAIAACVHVLAILLLSLVSPTLHIPPRPPEPDAPQPASEVELTRLPAPRLKKVEPRRIERPTRTAEAAPAQTPQVLSRPSSPTTVADSAPVLQPAPHPEAAPRPKPAPAPPVATVDARAPSPDQEKEKEKERERELEKARLQSQLAAASKAEAPVPAPPIPAPPTPARPTTSAAAPFVPAPGFRLAPGYGRTGEPDGGGGLRSVLRATVGCAHETYAALTPEERERCARSFVRDAAHGVRVDPVPADKRQSYDVEAAANARRRAAKTGGTASPVVACDGAGANLGGGCLPDEAHVHIKPQSPQ